MPSAILGVDADTTIISGKPARFCTIKRRTVLSQSAIESVTTTRTSGFGVRPSDDNRASARTSEPGALVLRWFSHTTVLSDNARPNAPTFIARFATFGWNRLNPSRGTSLVAGAAMRSLAPTDRYAAFSLYSPQTPLWRSATPPCSASSRTAGSRPPSRRSSSVAPETRTSTVFGFS